ncbi:histidine phosphatase family protein [Pseudomonas sp. NA-150]|uniref:lipopolysaccharide core heptose(II)-phosphate phosphatase PmrG n=1 Tax=Pseudomonas sp. NA-150 TaxID=3367525 RepID=UPI0037CC5461
MQYRLWLARTRLSFTYSNLAKHKLRLAILACVGVGAIAGITLTRQAKLPNLSKADAATIAGFEAQWAKGDMIVLVRHAERCDHSSAPCLGPADGITVRGKAMAQEVGLQFQKLGMERADIYSSPLTRAAQTSGFMFNYASEDQGWLFDCRKTMLADALRHKVKNRNLVLVTHSECFSALEQQLDLPESKTPEFASSLFLTVGDDGLTPRVTGFINANEWPKVLGK